jgi:hypothetical protein
LLTMRDSKVAISNVRSAVSVFNGLGGPVGGTMACLG